MVRVLIAMLILTTAVQARQWYKGQYDNVPSNVTAWYKGLRSNQGFMCCDISDCHICNGVEANGDPSPCDSWDMKDGHYRVLYRGHWMDIPDNKVINNTNNPTGDANVCLSNALDPVVYCFVPGGGS